jgi:hypothetical protein
MGDALVVKLNRMGSRSARVAWAIAIVTAAVAALGVTITLLNHARIDTDQVVGNVGFIVPIMAFAVVGALIGSRRPENSVGWICMAIGLLFAVVIAGDAISTWGLQTGSLPRELCRWFGWITAAWVPALGLMGTQLPLRLPDGHPLTAGWGRYARLCTVAIAAVTFVMVTQPDIDQATGLSNPTGIGFSESLGPLVLLLPVSFLGAMASVVVRYRRSPWHERHQLRWVAFGAAIFIGSYVVSVAILTGAGVADDSTLGIALTTTIQMAYAAIPIAIGIAVLRHRLYDIDVVLNRALVYASLTATLGAAYLAVVLVLQLVLAPLTEDSGLAVAASTLAVAGLFRPARSRVQSAVDRRFYRRKYDAVQALDSFSARLRDEIDLDSLSGELREVILHTMQPAHISIWLRPPAGPEVETVGIEPTSAVA